MSEHKETDNAWLEENIAEARDVAWSRSSLPSRFDDKDTESDHTHCIICWKALDQRTFPCVYESSIGWICPECYEKHIKA